ncbi:glycosyl hydrolase family 47-domain-containing protein [Baffinella frigidus]|nr:glycosyl hydrolase family 47-domain-containing protein [Cryptophyta sp. CCMP2293]
MAVRPTRCSAVPAWLCVAALLFLASLHSASLQDTGGTSICSSEREECEVEELLAEISGASDDAAKGEDAAGDGRAWARRGGAFQADESLDELRDRAVRMFYHGYDSYMEHAFPHDGLKPLTCSYMEHAFPHDELKPLTCSFVDNFGSYALTLVDSLDTLAVLGNRSEFARGVTLISAHVSFDTNVSVSVFETNIRVLGGLPL